METSEEREAIAEKIEKLGDESKYQEQAKAFMEYTGTTIEAVEAVPQSPPLWTKECEKHGIKYSVTMKNDRSTYIFPFWGSINDAEMLEIAKRVDGYGNGQSAEAFKLKEFLKGKGLPFGMTALGIRALSKTREAITPNTYTILSCLSPMCEDNFEDFCASYGYDVDSRTAYKTYNAVLEQDRAMRKLFTAEELELLQMIN